MALKYDPITKKTSGGVSVTRSAPAQDYSARPDQLASIQKRRGQYGDAMGVDLHRGAGIPDNGGQDYRMVGLTGNASAKGSLPKTGAIISKNGVKAWGSDNYGFYGTTTPNNFTLGNAGNARTGFDYAGAVGGGGGGSGSGGGMGGRSGSGGMLANRLGGQDQADQNTANDLNNQRYEEAKNTNDQGFQNQQAFLGGALGQQQDFLNNVLGQQQAALQGAGGTAHEMENRRLGKQLGSSSQSLIGRGLGNSTIVDAMAKGHETDSALIQNAINEGVNQQRLGILGQYGQMGNANLGNYAQMGNANIGNATSQRIGIVGSKVDQGPNVGASLGLLQQAGAQGGAGAGGNSGPKGGFVLNDNTGGGQQQGSNPLADYIKWLAGGQGQQGQQPQGGGFDFGGAFQGASNPPPAAQPEPNRMGGYGDQNYGPSPAPAGQTPPYSAGGTTAGGYTKPRYDVVKEPDGNVYKVDTLTNEWTWIEGPG